MEYCEQNHQIMEILACSISIFTSCIKLAKFDVKVIFWIYKFAIFLLFFYIMIISFKKSTVQENLQNRGQNLRPGYAIKDF